MSKYKIRQCFQPDDEWIQVEIFYEYEPPRVVLHRVIMWALIDIPICHERIAALTRQGLPAFAFGQDSGSYYYVKAYDKSPSGQTWKQLFDAIVPSPLGVHELSAEQARAFQVKPDDLDHEPDGDRCIDN